MTLPTYKILDPNIERLPYQELQVLQSERLVNMVHYVYESSPFWKNKFQEAGVLPEEIKGIEDLHRIPFCTKSELQKDQETHQPFGSYTCSDPSSWAHFMTTSGTTGRPLRRLLSHRDFDYIVDYFHRRGLPLVPGDKYMFTGPTDALSGPTMFTAILQRFGVMVVKAGLLDTNAKLDLILELKPQGLSGTPSYLLHLAEKAKQRGINLAELGCFKGISSFGEPGANLAANQNRLKAAFGVEFVVDGYGMTEICSLGTNCPSSSGFHLPSDLVVAEIVDAKTGNKVDSGEKGELVITNLFGDTQPLLRFRTGDITSLSPPGEACECGFTGQRVMGIEGRKDDMIWYRGVNIYPSAIEEKLREQEELGTEFRILINQDGDNLPTMTIQVEANPSISEHNWLELSKKIEGLLKTSLRVNAIVEVVASGTLPSVDAKKKSRRVIYNKTSLSARS
ncbi:phenylacetate--CoA ligase family protein [Halalkalibacter okhensis]|uniref:Phenylacetate--CoA ligase n=1 Tax=Halalkalibacter okhensis TaxID=333138 RepID=A0A0B0INE5_9BACI|nr:AMP-binding protein [Halalkalibacter okhensis]KHF41604.1 hypothetical protein LQ50_02555 [Halalkalibacter okhensis]